MVSSLPPKRSMSLLKHREMLKKRKLQSTKQRLELGKTTKDTNGEPECQPEKPTLQRPRAPEPLPDHNSNPSLMEQHATMKRPRSQKPEDSESEPDSPRNRSVMASKPPPLRHPSNPESKKSQVSKKVPRRWHADESESDHDVPETSLAVASKLKSAENKPRKKRSKSQTTLESKSSQRWTELTAVSHMLADEVHLYLQPNNELAGNTLSSGEERQLNAWSVAVEKQIYRQSGLVLENVHLAAELRESFLLVQRARDDLMILRTRTKKFDHESEDLERQISKVRKDEDALQGATHFLSALQSGR
jgi:hypothetical protein